jgi:hypothetical protein
LKNLKRCEPHTGTSLQNNFRTVFFCLRNIYQQSGGQIIT